MKNPWLAESLCVEFTGAEVLALLIRNNKESITLASIYRPPSANINVFHDEMTALLNKSDEGGLY